MNKEKLKKSLLKAKCALELNRKIVGIKLLPTREEFKAASAREVSGKMRYCVMVKSASLGHGIKLTGENFSCMGSARALGIIEPNEEYTSGKSYKELGLYKDERVSKSAIENITLKEHGTYGVMVKPLEDFDTEPDVVIMIANPYNTMRIIQGYSYVYGINPSYKMSGNQAICAECTSYPLESNDINVSLLCAGTRHSASWGENEMAIGLPFSKFIDVIDGVWDTANATEPNDKKAKIREKMKESELEGFKLKDEESYFLKK